MNIWTHRTITRLNTINSLCTISKNIDPAPMSTSVMGFFYSFFWVYSIFIIWNCWLKRKGIYFGCVRPAHTNTIGYFCHVELHDTSNNNCRETRGEKNPKSISRMEFYSIAENKWQRFFLKIVCGSFRLW